MPAYDYGLDNQIGGGYSSGSTGDNYFSDNGNGTVSDPNGNTFDNAGNLVNTDNAGNLVSDAASTGATADQSASAADNSSAGTSSPSTDQSNYLVATDSAGGTTVMDQANQNHVVYQDYIDQQTGELIVATDELGLSGPQFPTGFSDIPGGNILDLGSGILPDNNTGGGGGDGAAKGSPNGNSNDVLVLDPVIVTAPQPVQPVPVIAAAPVDTGGTSDLFGNAGDGSGLTSPGTTTQPPGTDTNLFNDPKSKIPPVPWGVNSGPNPTNPSPPVIRTPPVIRLPPVIQPKRPKVIPPFLRNIGGNANSGAASSNTLLWLLVGAAAVYIATRERKTVRS